jgi:hypothetical protein
MNIADNFFEILETVFGLKKRQMFDAILKALLRTFTFTLTKAM